MGFFFKTKEEKLELLLKRRRKLESRIHGMYEGVNVIGEDQEKTKKNVEVLRQRLATLESKIKELHASTHMEKEKEE
ncbi:hypothetical protein ACFL96_12600 [Thermoproteota archaeon]